MLDIGAALAVAGTLILLGLLFAGAAVYSREQRQIPPAEAGGLHGGNAG